MPAQLGSFSYRFTELLSVLAYWNLLEVLMKKYVVAGVSLTMLMAFLYFQNFTSLTTVNVNFSLERLKTNFSPFNIVQHHNITSNPSSEDPASLYSNLKNLNIDYYELFLNEKSADFLCGTGPTCAYNYSKLDILLDRVVKNHNINVYLRLAQFPAFVRTNIKDNGYTRENAEAVGEIMRNIASHAIARYGLHITRNWIFSFDNENRLDIIANGLKPDPVKCPGLVSSTSCAGAEIYSEWFSIVAGKIKSVDSKLRVAVMESFNGYVDYMVRYLVHAQKLHLLKDVDILSYHHYGIGDSRDSTYNALASIDKVAGPALWDIDALWTTKNTRKLLNDNGLSRIQIWQGENNFNSSWTPEKLIAGDIRNLTAEGGIFFALSALKQGESGLSGLVHWQDVDNVFGIMSWQGNVHPVYYGIELMEKVLGLYGNIKFFDITPTNANQKNYSDIRTFAVSTVKGKFIVAFNINETDENEIDIVLKSPELSSKSTLEAYTYNAATSGPEALKSVASLPFQEVKYLSGRVAYSIPPMTMTIFKLCPNGLCTEKILTPISWVNEWGVCSPVIAKEGKCRDNCIYHNSLYPVAQNNSPLKSLTSNDTGYIEYVVNSNGYCTATYEEKIKEVSTPIQWVNEWGICSDEIAKTAGCNVWNDPSKVDSCIWHNGSIFGQKLNELRNNLNNKAVLQYRKAPKGNCILEKVNLVK